MALDYRHPDYVDLKKRIRENGSGFVAIVGAGLSIPAGLPNWTGLRDRLVQDGIDRQSAIPENERQGYLSQLTRLQKEGNLWHAFTELKRVLPSTAYENCIKKALTISDKSRIPSNYAFLWKLGIKGIVTFNLDTCAIDSFATVNHSAADCATAREIARYAHYLASPYPFVFQPHGHISDSDTWIFTQAEMNKLYGISAYVEFMKALCQSCHLLILGFNVGDFSFKYLIQQALSGRSNTGAKHYLVLSGAPPADIHAYGEAGFSVIPYIPEDSQNHSEIGKLLKDCLDYMPADEIPSSVYMGEQNDPKSLPSDAELVKYPIPEIRKLLNGAVASIIPPDGSPQETDIKKLKLFYEEHVRAMHMAWLIHPSPDCNDVHGYRVTNKRNRGAFGQVYEAVDTENGDRVALKVLLPEVRESEGYLTCFRRGVKSMRILAEHNIPRMVKLYNAYEVPACIVMEYVDGPTLSEAENWGYLVAIDRCLDVLVQIGETVVTAHNLDERVLHRDLKPDNVILRECYSATDPLDVIVLDFDLSWHKGAYEMSVVQGARAQGYAAPEQTATGLKAGVSTRNTAVDVFGFGMLAYFLFVGDNPRPNEHNISGYKNRIRDSIKKRFSPNWRALPAYLAGVVADCTGDEQAKRISMATAIEAFKESLRMLSSDRLTSAHPLILEEIVANLEPEGEIMRGDFGRTLKVNCKDQSKEIELKLTNDEQEVIIEVHFAKVRSEEDSRNVAKYLEAAKSRALGHLNVSFFKDVRGIIGQSRIDIYTKWKPGIAVKESDITRVCEILAEARAALSLG